MTATHGDQPLEAVQLRAARGALGCSLVEVSIQARISVSFLRRVECGSQPADSLDQMRRLEEFYRQHGIYFVSDSNGIGILIGALDSMSNDREAKLISQ